MRRLFSFLLVLILLAGTVSFAQADPEFEIENGVLVKYHGEGGAVTVPDGVTTIGKEAFYYAHVTSVKLPESVTEIEYEAFYECTELTEINFPSRLTRIGDHAFYKCRSLTSIKLPKALTEMGDHAFAYCYGLTKATIPGKVKTISSGMFTDCYNLTTVVIQNGVTTIGPGVFFNCYSLASVSIPASVTTFQKSSDGDETIFMYCPKTLVISCKAGSVAAKYAKKNGIKYVTPEPSELTISFNANGGEGKMKALSVKEGSSVKLTANKFTKSGYVFKGWNTKKNGKGTSYKNSAKITPAGNLTLYAQWTEVSLSLEKVSQVKRGKKLILSATLKLDGKAVKGKTVTFIFNGQEYTAETNKKGVAAVTITAFRTKKLTAGSKVKIKVIYQGNAASQTVKVK